MATWEIEIKNDTENFKVSHEEHYVDMAPLKTKALRYSEPVKSFILSEPDRLKADAFIEKLSTWLKLLRIAQEGQK